MIFLNNSQNLEDAFLSSMTSSEIYKSLTDLANKIARRRMMAKFSILDDEMDELIAEAVYRSFKMMEEKGITDNLEYSGRCKKIEKMGKFVVLGDLFAMARIILLNCSKDYKKYLMAEKRLGGVHVTIIDDVDNPAALCSNVNPEFFTVPKDPEKNLATNDLLRYFLTHIHKTCSDDQGFIDFVNMKTVRGLSRKEIVESGMSYSKYKKYENKLQELANLYLIPLVA